MKYPKLFLAANARKLLMVLGITYIFTTFLLVLNLYATQRYFYEDRNPSDTLIFASRDVLWSSECEIMTFVAFAVLIIAGSMMFGALSDRRSRLNTIEVPASQGEKFLTWLMVYLPLTIVSLWVCFYLAQITRVCWTHLFTDFGSYAHVIPVHRVILLQGDLTLHVEDVYESVATYGAMIFVNSLFALGSVFFPKLSFLKTAISASILASVIGVTALLGHLTFFGPDGSTETRFLFLEDYLVRDCMITGLLIFGACCCYALCYYRYKQTEIIDRW